MVMKFSVSKEFMTAHDIPVEIFFEDIDQGYDESIQCLKFTSRTENPGLLS